jgi:hypothetical protein
MSLSEHVSWSYLSIDKFVLNIGFGMNLSIEWFRWGLHLGWTGVELPQFWSDSAPLDPIAIVRSQKISSFWSGFLQNICRERKEQSYSFWRATSLNEYVQSTCRFLEKSIEWISRPRTLTQSGTFLRTHWDGQWIFWSNEIVSEIGRYRIQKAQIYVWDRSCSI